MKKTFALSIIALIAMVCSCQKNDSATQQQLVQRKVELDAREEELTERKSALDEREKALDEREKAVTEKGGVTANAQITPTDVPSQTSDPAQVQPENDMIPEEPSDMIPDSSQMDLEKAEKEREAQRAQEQIGADELERERQRKLKAAEMSPAPR